MCLYYIQKFLWNTSIPFWDSPRSSAAQSAPSVLQSYPVTAHRWRGIMMSADVSSVVCLGTVGSSKRLNVAIQTEICPVCCRLSVSYPYSVPIHPSFFPGLSWIIFGPSFSASAGWFVNSNHQRCLGNWGLEALQVHIILSFIAHLKRVFLFFLRRVDERLAILLNSRMGTWKKLGWPFNLAASPSLPPPSIPFQLYQLTGAKNTQHLFFWGGEWDGTSMCRGVAKSR